MGRVSLVQQSARRACAMRWRNRTITPAHSLRNLLRTGRADCTAHHTRSKVNRVQRMNCHARRWKTMLTIAPSRLRHRRTGLPAGYGLFVACPSCKLVQEPRKLTRVVCESDEKYWFRADAAAAKACEHWHRRGRAAPIEPHSETAENLPAAGWPTPVFVEGSFIGDYVGLRKDAAATGTYVMLVDQHLLKSVPADGAYCIDGASGSILKYCNGRSTPKECNVTVRESDDHLAQHKAQKGRASVPVVATRPLYPHDELLICYGKAYCKQLPDYKDYIIT